MGDKDNNFPAVSAKWAMREYPNARHAERDMLISLADLRKGMTVLDLQAAGGYLADGIFEYLNGEVDLICLEPCEALSSRLSSRYHLVEDKVESWSSIKSDSIDVVLGLAGLHHSENQLETVCEAYRALKPGGQLVICDVIDDSDIALWLNEYVDRHNPSGHKGTFLNKAELSELYRQAGFYSMAVKTESVPWLFDTEEGAGRFFKGLFGLNVSEVEVLKAMKERLSLIKHDDCCLIDWKLVYGKAVK